MEPVRVFKQSDAADRFGKLVVENVRDRLLDFLAMLFRGSVQGEGFQNVQRQLAAMTPEQKSAVSDVVAMASVEAMHGLLHALQAAHDLDEGIAVMVDGLNIAEESQMLHGDLVGEGGWIDQFSRFRDLGDYKP